MDILIPNSEKKTFQYPGSPYFTFNDMPCNVVRHTRPFALLIGNQEYKVSAWKHIWLNIVRYLYKTQIDTLLRLRNKACFNATRRICFKDSRHTLVRGDKITDYLWVETNFNAIAYVNLSIELAALGQINLEGIIVFYNTTRKLLSQEKIEQDFNNKPLIEVSETDKQVPETRITSIQTVDIEALKALICRDFSNGFVFNAGTIKLLENKLGRDCSETEQRELKRIMFKRSDDVYLLPEMVAEDDTIADMTARIREYFAEYGYFSLSILFEEFGYVLKNLTNPDSDFRLFLLKTILPDDGKIFGRLQRQICIPGNISEEEVTQTLAERIREMLQGYGDAVCIDDLDNELPYLNKSALEMILQEHIADAIEIKVDGLSYWKLVEFFCLPDDFAEYLQLTVSSMEEAQTAPSLQTLSEAMEQQYGEGFREIYAVDDDDVFKQIIKVCIADDQYSWNRNVFAKQNAGQELNVADEFLQTQQGIFHESEFFDYASTHRGLTNTGMLILTFLRNKCIRLDQTHWISLKDFDNFSNFSTDMAEAIARELDLLRGSKAFLPLGTLTEAFLSNLPVFTINEQVFYWNHYLLASVAAHKISEVQVINDEPSPYTVTAMIIPQQVKIQGDVIDYIFQDLRKTHCIFSSANDVFEYLRTHQVRMVKTKKLFARIRDFWGVE